MTDKQKLVAKRSILINALEGEQSYEKIGTITYLIREINMILKDM